jgi:hypothetical protein
MLRFSRDIISISGVCIAAQPPGPYLSNCDNPAVLNGRAKSCHPANCSVLPSEFGIVKYDLIVRKCSQTILPFVHCNHREIVPLSGRGQ